MASTNYPANYVRFTDQQTKQLNVVLCIDGLDQCFGMVPTFTRVRYGDPGIFYGQAGLVYGGLRLDDTTAAWIMSESSLSLQQRLEPEQGRASISQLTFQIIDKDGRVSKIVSPGGGVLPEILGRAVTVRLGYVETSFPEDYSIVFRGIITGVTIQAGRVSLVIGDPGQKRRSACFKVAKTELAAGIDAVTTSIPVEDSTGFYDPIVDENATAFLARKVRPYLRIEDELMGYGFGALTPTLITVDGRGGVYSRGTTAAPHGINQEVGHAIALTDNAITLALKVMLSGWNGPWKTGVLAAAYGTPVDPNVTFTPQVILLPENVDASLDYGLVIGDTVTVVGSIAGNDQDYIITGFGDAFDQPNRLIYTDLPLNLENPANGSLSFRSKYDVLPTNAGVKLTPEFVDVKTHESIRDSFFSGTENVMDFYITDQQTAKEFCEKELYLPLGAYSLTRYGRLSIGYTKPPIAQSDLVFLDYTNVTQPEAIQIERSLNTRKFFNEIQYEYDKADAGNFQSVLRVLDTDSLNEIGMLTLLPISASGVKTTQGGGILAARVARRLLTRYKTSAVQITLSTLWNPGALIEVGDVVCLTDNGELKITNFETGERKLGQQLFEVLDRTMDIKTGKVSLKLVAGIASNINDRYATISPASQISSTDTTFSQVRVKNSFGRASNEWQKWEDFIGQKVLIHSPDYTDSAEVVLQSLNAVDPYILEFASALPFLPGEDYLVEIPNYPTSTDKTENSLYKLLHAFIDPTLQVTVGLGPNIFSVAPADVPYFIPGLPVTVHSADYSNDGPESTTQQVVGNDIILNSNLSFTPAAGDLIELIGFPDGQGPYRLL